VRRLGPALLLLTTLPLAASASSDATTVNRIVDAEYNHGQVVQIVAHLTDQIGGRLTNSPAMREAERWTQAQFESWGLQARREGFEFGRGWWIEPSSARMLAPRPIALRSIPVAWTPATNGTISAPIVVAPMSEEKHFAEWRGKLAGKIVLVTLPGAAKDATDPAFQRLSDTQVRELDSFEAPNNDPDAIKPRLKRRAFALKLDAFLKAEGALAWARMSGRPNGLVHGDGYTYQVGKTPQVPAVEIAAEDYRRLARLALAKHVDPHGHAPEADAQPHGDEHAVVALGEHRRDVAALHHAGQHPAGGCLIACPRLSAPNAPTVRI